MKPAYSYFECYFKPDMHVPCGMVTFLYTMSMRWTNDIQDQGLHACYIVLDAVHLLMTVHKHVKLLGQEYSDRVFVRLSCSYDSCKVLLASMYYLNRYVLSEFDHYCL